MPRKRNQQPRSRDTSGTGDHSLLRKGDQMRATVSDLPTMERQAEALPTAKPDAEAKQPEKIKATLETLSLDIPHISGSVGYVRRRVDLTLNREQATRLKGILQGLERQDAKLQNGRFVSTQLHAIQWMIENVG